MWADLFWSNIFPRRPCERSGACSGCICDIPALWLKTHFVSIFAWLLAKPLCERGFLQYKHNGGFFFRQENSSLRKKDEISTRFCERAKKKKTHASVNSVLEIDMLSVDRQNGRSISLWTMQSWSLTVITRQSLQLLIFDSGTRSLAPVFWVLVVNPWRKTVVSVDGAQGRRNRRDLKSYNTSQQNTTQHYHSRGVWKRQNTEQSLQSTATNKTLETSGGRMGWKCWLTTRVGAKHKKGVTVLYVRAWVNVTATRREAIKTTELDSRCLE